MRNIGSAVRRAVTIDFCRTTLVGVPASLASRQLMGGSSSRGVGGDGDACEASVATRARDGGVGGASTRAELRRDSDSDSEAMFPFMCDADGACASGAALGEGAVAPADVLRQYPHGVYTVGRARRGAGGGSGVGWGSGAFALSSAEFHLDRLCSRDARWYIAHGREDGSVTASTSMPASSASSAPRACVGDEDDDARDVEAAFRAKVMGAIARALDHATTRTSAHCDCVVVTVSVHRGVAVDGDALDGISWARASDVDVKTLVTSYSEFDTADETFGAYVDVDSSVRRAPVSVKYADWIHGRAKASAALADWNARCDERLKCVEYLLTKSHPASPSDDGEGERLELLEGLTSNFLLITNVNGTLTAHCAKPGLDVLDGVAMRALTAELTRRGIPLIERAPNAFPIEHRSTWVAAYLTSAIKGIVPLDFILFHGGKDDAGDGCNFRSAPLPASRAMALVDCY